MEACTTNSRPRHDSEDQEIRRQGPLPRIAWKYPSLARKALQLDLSHGNSIIAMGFRITIHHHIPNVHVKDRILIIAIAKSQNCASSSSKWPLIHADLLKSTPWLLGTCANECVPTLHGHKAGTLKVQNCQNECCQTKKTIRLQPTGLSDDSNHHGHKFAHRHYSLLRAG